MTNEDNIEQIFKIFLLGCVNDKPATSLLLNHDESIGFFGCSYCTIKGWPDLLKSQESF
ncbi:hypothetical protein I4U23_005731 [Adineta vaga]|nr:hypothetical protein I4U23_005731 [Adineta vaga]